MFGLMAQARSHQTFEESICVTSSNRVHEDRRDSPLCGLLQIERDFNSFPLPRIEEALQAVQAAMWFTSFDLGPRLFADGHGGRRHAQDRL